MNHVGGNVVIMLYICHPDPRMQDQRLMEYSGNMTCSVFQGLAGFGTGDTG